ncbi:16S rRNA (cytidine(1402)-2'-O)-methyltransferase [Spiroplasma culicicola]|uniref:Methyltransferase n=1 Tax=Spiroplasma culicicola AES-1 TaxID=1276246 RepID=W6A6M2_9MOLU|nr:16S rRNA (cytidine(1402)-2'-O)-methyltransferase [Spiroplasma culicicola]AHI52621.1 methyltransferase [Spiroplasma culicicola AES-1]
MIKLQVKNSFKDNYPKLYVIGTPIGNLNDISPRVIESFNDVAKIYCEDTRDSKKLVDHLKIIKPLYALHKFNEVESSQQLILDLQNGLNIALISDAGVPCISDPGSKVIEQIYQHTNQFNIVPVNCGPAYIHAIVASGFVSNSNLFLGFLDKKPEQIKNQLSKFANTDCIVSFHESVHRVKNTINLLNNFLDKNTLVSLSREITKVNEQHIRGAIFEIFEYINSKDFIEKGEFVICIESNYKLKDSSIDKEIDYIALINQLIEQGISKKEAIKQISKKYGLNKAELYNNFHKK